MGKVIEMRAITFIQKANQGAEIREDFDINFGGEILKLRLSAPDMFTIAKDQERCYQKEYALCTEDGMDKMQVNEADWIKELDRIEDVEVRKVMEADKPVNLAQQVASKNARFDTIVSMIPKILREQASNELVCKDQAERNALADTIKSNPAIMTLLTEKYIQIITKINEVSKEAKNSQTALKSSDSKKPLQEDTI